MSDSPNSFADAIAYRQQARRLRARLGNNPAALHRALSELNGKSPADLVDHSTRPATPRLVRHDPEESWRSADAPPVSTNRVPDRESSTMVWAITARRPTFDRGPAAPRMRLVPADPPAPPRPQVRRIIPDQLPTTDATRDSLERGFARAVEQRLAGAVLRCSDRQALLGAADRMHLDRFRANLIIALVQRAAASGRSAADAMELAKIGAGNVSGARNAKQQFLHIAGWVTLAVLLETAIGGLAWWMWM